MFFAWPSRRAVFGIGNPPRPPMRTETAVRPQIASRTRETQPDPATPRRRQPSRAPTTASAASAATGGPSGAESADVLGIVKDPMSRPTDLANAASESVLGASNAGAGDPQRRRPFGGGRQGGRQRGQPPSRRTRAPACSGEGLAVQEVPVRHETAYGHASLAPGRPLCKPAILDQEVAVGRRIGRFSRSGCCSRRRSGPRLLASLNSLS